MAGATFRQFEALGPVITVDALDWMVGANRWFKDVTTGFFCMFTGTESSGSGNVELWVKESVFSKPYRVATDASNSSNPHPDFVIATVQSSSGKVHALMEYNSGVNRQYYISRFALTITSGKIVGYTIDATALALPQHSSDGTFDPRGNIIMGTKAGTEVAIYIWQAAFGTDTTFEAYAGYVNLSGTITSTGLTGTGTDTQVYSRTKTANVGAHNMQPMLVQESTSEALHIIEGSLCSDYALGVAQSTDWDIADNLWTISGSNWVSAGRTVLYTLPGGGGVQPMLCHAYGVAGKAALCYSIDSGLYIGYWDSSNTWTSNWVQLNSNTGLAHMASFTTDGTKIWGVYNAYDALAANPTGEYFYYTGSELRKSRDCFAAKTEGYYGCTGWNSGALVMRGTVGDVLAQTRSGNQVAAITDIAPSDFPILGKRDRRKVSYGMNWGTNVKEWW